jgi:hypothetical protein
VNDPTRPHISDQRLAHVATDREVHVEAVAARMQLGCPRVWKRPPAQLVP